MKSPPSNDEGRPPPGEPTTAERPPHLASDEANSTDLLLAEATAIAQLNATVLDATDIGTNAIDYALHGWPVFPCRGKVPAIPNPHPKGSDQRRSCKGECGLQGHGVHDATTDITQIAHWWGGRYAGCNIGGRIPLSMAMIDIDPYKGGIESLAVLEDEHEPLPVTLTDMSGRGDGGKHFFFRRPSGKLTDKRLGRGIDLKTSTGYGVLPPSIHPDTGKPYTRIEAPVAAPPGWLIDLLRVQPAAAPKPAARRVLSRGFTCPSIADQFNANTSWAQILEPHGWRCIDADPDADGAVWLHPTHTSTCSATIRHGCLFVYSTNTPFDVTEPGDRHGYTKFRAYAVLNHGGDMSAAARALREVA